MGNAISSILLVALAVMLLAACWCDLKARTIPNLLNLAVAFAEEFFYRGYMTVRFEERWGPVRSALTAAALFAVGHLLTPAPWRLAVFFPALLFAWLRNRTGTIVGASIAHFLSNVWLLLLERSAF